MGQARVLSDEQIEYLFSEIKNHRYPEKNTAIMYVSFKLGLRAQEISMLKIKDVCRLSKSNGDIGFTLYEILALPACYTKGARAKSIDKNIKPSRVSFEVDEFKRILKKVELIVKSGGELDVDLFMPISKQKKGKSRDLPMVDQGLREALCSYIKYRIDTDPALKMSSPLFLTQKNNSYSPNTLQEHMALMLRGWAGIEKATSHSGRRSVLTNIIHKQGKSVKVAQKVAGHKSAATTLIYEEPPLDSVKDALRDV